jgi:hypothetical protein
VEKELDILIERRSRQADPEEEHELWRESVRRHNERVQEGNRAAWAAFHEGQAERHRRTLEELIARHEMQGARLCEKGP